MYSYDDIKLMYDWGYLLQSRLQNLCLVVLQKMNLLK